MRRLLSLKKYADWAVELPKGGNGKVAYFTTWLKYRSGVLVEIDPGNAEDALWLQRLRRHYAKLGFVVMDPDADGNIEVRYYTTGDVNTEEAAA